MKYRLTSNWYKILMTFILQEYIYINYSKITYNNIVFR